jgi:hypothetical protein
MRKEQIMSKPDIDMDELWEQVQAEISARGFATFPGIVVATEHNAYWPEDEGLSKFLDLAQVLERKVVYIKSSNFTQEDALDYLLLTAPSDLVDFEVASVRDCLRSLGVETTQEAKDYLKLANFYDGRRDLIRVDWVYDGIIHIFKLRPEWSNEILDLAEKIADLSESLTFNFPQD